MQREIDRLINLYRTNALAQDQAETLAQWLEESEQNRTYFKRSLAERPTPISAKTEREWARFAVRNKILFAAPVSAVSRRQLVRRYTMAAAAVLTVGICGTWMWLSAPQAPTAIPAQQPVVAQQVIYRTFHGERLNIVLPDSSRVYMNSDATLTVDPNFGQKTREIEFDGEAFFNITSDKQRPFIIHSANNSYTVLGTSFNLQSYAKEDFAVVTLHTGCLQAQIKKDVIILDPNEQLQIDAATNTISKREVRVDDSIGWLDGRLVFSGHPLKDVANKLSRYYQMKVNVHEEIAGLQYTGTVDKESLSESLRMIIATSPVKLSITNIDGEYFLSRAKRK